MLRFFQYSRIVTDKEINDLITTNEVEVNVLTFENSNDMIASVSGSNEALETFKAIQIDEIKLQEIQADEFALLADSSDQVRRIREQASELLTGEMKSIDERYPKEERDTWNTQVCEAEAFQTSGNEADAPFLKTLADAEGDIVENFANNVLIKKQQFEIISAVAISKKRQFIAQEMSKFGL